MDVGLWDRELNAIFTEISAQEEPNIDVPTIIPTIVPIIPETESPHIGAKDVILAIDEASKFRMIADAEVMKANVASIVLVFAPLEACLCEGSLRSATREKSWTKFHACVSSLHLTSTPPNVTRYLALKVFQTILDRKWPPVDKDTVVISSKGEIQDSDKDILSYIGGAILRKLRERYGEEKRIIIDALACGADDPCVSISKLTKTKDRGGLTYIKSSTQELLVTIEKVFISEAENNVTTVSKAKFLETCIKTAEDAFLACLVESGSSNLDHDQHDNIFDVMKDFFTLFFKIRVHHRCKIMKEKIAIKGKKGLRKSLKENKSQKEKNTIKGKKGPRKSVKENKSQK